MVLRMIGIMMIIKMKLIWCCDGVMLIMMMNDGEDDDHVVMFWIPLHLKPFLYKSCINLNKCELLV